MKGGTEWDWERGQGWYDGSGKEWDSGYGDDSRYSRNSGVGNDDGYSATAAAAASAAAAAAKDGGDGTDEQWKCRMHGKLRYKKYLIKDDQGGLELFAQLWLSWEPYPRLRGPTVVVLLTQPASPAR